MLDAVARPDPAWPFIAIDWGTTNRRIYRIDRGSVTGAELDGPGVKRMDARDYPEELAGIRDRMGNHPILCVGMAGSSIGWLEMPYIPLPATLSELARAVVAVAPRVWMVPGAATTGSPADVMRGEEVQFLGVLASGAIMGPAVVLQPGTHAKWARVGTDGILDFTTAMTGELYELLARHSTLRTALDARAEICGDFAEGVRRGRAGGLATELFRVRAEAILNGLDAARTSALASGILIGAEVAALLGDAAEVYVIDDGPLGALYCEAIRLCGGTAIRLSSRDAFCAGARAIWEHMA